MKRLTILLTLIVLVLLLAGNVLAQSGDGYALTWSTVDGGGATFSTGGSYTLGGTIGQPEDAGVLMGGDYTLGGGFWSYGTMAVRYRIYLPIVLKNFWSQS